VLHRSPIPDERRGGHPGAQRFGEHQHVAGSGLAFGEERIGLRHPERHQPILRFFVLHRVSAPDDRPSLLHLLGTPSQDLSNNCRIQIDRHCRDIERQEGCGSHSIEVGESVGRRDGPEGIGVVHNRGKEICCHNQQARRIKPPYGGVIRSRQPDQQIGSWIGAEHFLNRAQNLRQRLRG